MSQPRKATPQPEPKVFAASEEDESDIFVPGGWVLREFFEMGMLSGLRTAPDATEQPAQ